MSATVSDKKGDNEPNSDSIKPVSSTRAFGRLSRALITGCALIASLIGFSNASFRRSTTLTQFPRSYSLCSKAQNIWTVDEKKPQIECFGVHDGRIFATGSRDDILANWSTIKAESDVKDSDFEFYHIEEDEIVVPGLTDAHGHVLHYGYAAQLPLDGAKSIDDVVQRLKDYIIAHPDVGNDKSIWIEGMGWDQNLWERKEFPTAADLSSDPLLKGRPIYLQRVDGHASWLSERALELTLEALGGTLPEKVDGGDIIKDADGQATGIFVDNAMALVPVPAWSESQTNEYFERAMKDLLAVGLTGVHDAATQPNFIEFFQKKADEGKLPLRLYLMGNVQSEEYWGDKIQRMENYGTHKRLTVKGVKLFTDGALGSWGAALLEPYSDRTDYSGILRISPEILESFIQRFWKDGFQTNIHCIGDRANHLVLDILERAFAQYPTFDARPRIEHSQILTQEDLKRIGRLGVIASVQPTHATTDMGYAETRLGPERIKGAYAYQTLLNLSPKGVLPLGSDFPVEGINPLLGFYAAVSRLSVQGDSPHGPDGWYPEQKLTRSQALKGMTLDAAYAAFAEEEIGSLVPGKKADFVILDKNIMSVPYSEILTTKVKATVIDGQIAYGGI